jgi:predicted Zn-dependent protease
MGKRFLGQGPGNRGQGSGDRGKLLAGGGQLSPGSRPQTSGPKTPRLTRLQRYLILAAVIILVPGALAVGWWYYLPEYVLSQAEKAAATNDLARAESLLQEVNRLAPDHVQARFLHAKVLRRLKRPAEAQAAIRRAMKLGLSEEAGSRELALAETLQTFGLSAEQNLLQILKANPDDVEVLEALAVAYARSQRWVEADTYYTHLLERQPDRLELLLTRGRARLAAVGKDMGRTEDAAADFREILHRSPDHYEARINLAHCLLSDARMAEAKPELLRCRQQAPQRVEPLAGLAACAVEERAWDEAEAFLRQALDLDPNSTYVLSMLGNLQLRQLHFQQAIPFFRQVLEREPGNQTARLKLAQALRHTGQVGESMQEERIYQEMGGEKGPGR